MSHANLSGSLYVLKIFKIVRYSVLFGIHMKYHDMTKEQLIFELTELKRRVVELEKSEKELKKTKEALSNAHAQLNATLNALPDFMFEVDRYGRIYDYRAPNPKLLYKPPQEFLGKKIENLLPKQTADLIMDAISQAVEKGRHIGTNYFLETPAGPGWFELSIAAKGDPKAQDCRLIVLIHDITKQKQTEEALRESERKYRDLIENSIDIHYLFDMEGNFVEVNDAFLKEGGYDYQDIVGKNFRAFLHPEDEKTALENFEKGVRGEPLEFEMKARKKDGSFGWYSFRNRPVKDQEGKITAVHGIARIITERKKAERELVESKEKYSTLIKTSPDAIATCDLSGRINYATPQTAKIYGYDSVDELVGIDLFDLVSPEDIEKVEIGLRDLINNGFLKNLECTHLRKDGSTFVGESNAAIIRDIYGEPIAAIAITRDITDRKRLEERFLRAQKMEAVATLTAGIAHDFNNILTTILGYASFLKRKA